MFNSARDVAKVGTTDTHAIPAKQKLATMRAMNMVFADYIFDSISHVHLILLSKRWVIVELVAGLMRERKPNESTRSRSALPGTLESFVYQ